MLREGGTFNADTVAGALAGALAAEKVIYLTDVAGLLADVDDHASIVARADGDALEAMIADGTIGGGMIPKVRACIEAVQAGARSAHMLDGRIPHVLLLELFTDAGIGTMVTGGHPEDSATGGHPEDSVTGGHPEDSVTRGEEGPA